MHITQALIATARLLRPSVEIDEGHARVRG